MLKGGWRRILERHARLQRLVHFGRVSRRFRHRAHNANDGVVFTSVQRRRRDVIVDGNEARRRTNIAIRRSRHQSQTIRCQVSYVKSSAIMYDKWINIAHYTQTEINGRGHGEPSLIS